MKKKPNDSSAESLLEPVTPQPALRLVRTWLVPLYFFGWELAYARRAAGLSRRDLAQLMGISVREVHACEKSLALPEESELPRIVTLAARLKAPQLVTAFRANCAALARYRHHPGPAQRA